MGFRSLAFYSEKIKRINLKANFMQLGKFIDVFLARYVSGTYTHPS